MQAEAAAALPMEYRATMLEKELSASTVNVRLSAVRKLVGEAPRNGTLDAEQAAQMMAFPMSGSRGIRLGNWLTRDQAKELLTVPNRSTLKGKRDYVILALLVGCALRRPELASLDIEDIQMPEGRVGACRYQRQRRPHSHRGGAGVGQASHQRLDSRGKDRRRPVAAASFEGGTAER